MISATEEKAVLERAYVPEHIVPLMASISRGEPFLIDDYLCFAGDAWVILVGYPLEAAFSGEAFASALGRVVKRFGPEDLWFIAPEVPPAAAHYCQSRERDWYYKLGLERFEVKPELTRLVRRASRELQVARAREILGAHEELIGEFLEREHPTPRLVALFLSMREYVRQSPTAVVLSATRHGPGDGRLSAFYVVELAAREFATYVVGCHSKAAYVPGASDLLCLEMVSLARERGKSYIHLGLGVNEGIRRFKEKWGGTPFLPYQFCEYHRGAPPLPASLLSKLA